MRQPTGRLAARQPQSLPRIFRRDRHIRGIWAYAYTSLHEGLWPRPTADDAAARVVRDIFDDARERVEEMAPVIRILSH